MPHNILHKTLYSSTSLPPLHILVSARGPMRPTFLMLIILGRVSFTALDLLTQVIWRVKFLQYKSWSSTSLVCATISDFPKYDPVTHALHGTIFDSFTRF